jgi:hypothetical protein
LCLAVGTERYLQAYAPSNAIVATVRRERPRVRVACGLLVLSAVLAFGAVALADWAARGGPGWPNLLVLIAVCDAFKFASLAVAIALRRALAALREAARPTRAPAAS